jgi:KRAB domain-containing zinc finger protein
MQQSDLEDGTVVTTISLNSGQTIVMGSKSDGIRPHCCDVCQKTFAKREHLTKHLRIHKSDNKRYSCEYCHKAFRDRYELVRHTRRHTGDFPFR